MTSPPEPTEPDAGAVAAHYEAMKERGAQQRDNFRMQHERLIAALQLNGIVVAVFIGLALLASPGDDFAGRAILTATGLASALASGICAAIGTFVREWLTLPKIDESEAAALRLSKVAYMLWASAEMQRALLANERVLGNKGRWAAAAASLTVAAVALAGATVISAAFT